MNPRVTSAAALVLLGAIACGGAESVVQPGSSISASKGSGGGGTQIPPSPSTDGPAWFFAEIGGVAGPSTANIDFDAMQNQSPGGISIGTSRTGAELVYNVSKKTALTITDISVVGANPGDFSIPDRATALATTLPANKGAVEEIRIVFTPTGEGLRTATVQFTSAAGVAQVFVRGTGLAARPIIAPIGPLTFLPTSAPANGAISNLGGQTLVITSISIGGDNPSAFQLDVANHGLSNCFAGEPLAPKSSCEIAVGLSPGAVAPAKATLVIVTNDPVTPTLVVPLTLTP